MLSMQELLQRALGGDATAAAELWRAIAEGKAEDAITAACARDVAKHVAAKVLNPETPANRRAELARAALGLEGRVDANWQLRELAERHPDITAAELAVVADLVVDVGKAKPHQIKRKIEYIRSKRK